MISSPASLRSDHWMLSTGIGGGFRLESLVGFAGIRIFLGQIVFALERAFEHAKEIYGYL